MNVALYCATDSLSKKMAQSARAARNELVYVDGDPAEAVAALEEVQDAATELLEIIARHKATRGDS